MDWDNLLAKPKADDPLHLNAEPKTKTIEDKIEAIVTAPPDAEEVKMLQEHMNKIEKDYDGISNIPHGHLYYDLRNRIQKIQNP